MQTLRWIATEDLAYGQESVSRVSKRAGQILRVLRENLTGPVDSVQYGRVCRELRRLITSAGAVEVICSELQAVLGCSLDRDQQVRLACSLAGAVADARESASVGVLSSEVEPIDCWAVIKDVKQTQDIKEDSYYHWRLLICNSVHAGSVLFTDIPLHSSRRWGRQLGLTGTRFKKLAWHSGLQFIDGVLIVRLEKQGGQLNILGAGVATSTVSHNRKLAASRSRQLSACHFGADYDCGRCGVGRNQCARSIVLEDTNFELESQ